MIVQTTIEVAVLSGEFRQIRNDARGERREKRRRKKERERKGEKELHNKTAIQRFDSIPHNAGLTQRALTDLLY